LFRKTGKEKAPPGKTTHRRGWSMCLFADESKQHTTATTHHGVVFNGKNGERGFVLIHSGTF
jgi:hypothetical protein